MAEGQELLDLLLIKITEAQILLDKCHILIEKQVAGSAKLKRKVQAELEFLYQLKRRPSSLRQNHVISTNLTHLNALYEAAMNCSDIAALLAPFPRQDEKQSNLLVDIVADGGSTWLKVVARSARGLHFAWAGEAGYRERGIIEQAGDYSATAQNNPFMYKSPNIIFLFCSGVTQPIVDDLKRKFKIESQGEIVPVDPSWKLSMDEDSESDASSSGLDEPENDADPAESSSVEICGCRHDSSSLASVSPTNQSVTGLPYPKLPLNLDITALIAYVSALTNDNGAQYRFKEPLLDEQASWERKRPALPWLRKFMDSDSGRQLLCCKTAYESFMAILYTVGGDGEKKRADSLLERVKIVDDQLSERAAKLQLGGKIKTRSRAIFGSGDYYQAVTLTANRGFVHAASNQGIRFAVIFHESRALSEQKQRHATLLDDTTLQCH